VAVLVGDGVIVGDGVMVGEGVIVGVFVAVGVFVGNGVFVGVGNTRGFAGLLMLHAASLNWIEKPKFAELRLNGGSLSAPPKMPSQSMRM
jgi:tetrahydrodipicolinate N-succinyltransferase